MDRRDHQSALVARQDTLEVALALGHLHIADPVAGDVLEELGLQLVPIDEHQHGRLRATLSLAQ